MDDTKTPADSIAAVLEDDLGPDAARSSLDPPPVIDAPAELLRRWAPTEAWFKWPELSFYEVDLTRSSVPSYFEYNARKYRK